MSITPDQILDLATKLVQQSVEEDIDEVVLRCSTSRAYYAALHAADNCLPPDLALTNSERRGKGSHQAVIDKVTAWSKAVRPGRTEAIFVARNLVRLRDLRKIADYAMSEHFPAADAYTAVRIATETIDRADRASSQAAA